MSIDWQTEANKYRQALLADLTTLINIPSVRDTAHATDDAPLGPGPAQALLAMLDIAKRDGFATHNIENVAGRIEYGSGATTLGILGHMDVVPAGDGWQHAPFVATIEGNRIYGRGSADDKGPALAAYYALRLLKEHGIVLQQQVHFILGSDEESNWYGMDRYQATNPMPDYGFSPDAEFPIINGEKGIASLTLHYPKLTHQAPLKLTAFEAGVRVNMVPGKAVATIQGALPTDWQAQLDHYAATHPVQVQGDLSAQGLTITVLGKGAHALDPAAGINAATHLATLIDPWLSDELFTSTIAKQLHEDPTGAKLGIAFRDAVMGELTCSADLFDYQAGTISLNVRYPQGITLVQIQARIQHALPKGVQVAITDAGHTPHYVPENDPLVQTLLAVYHDHTGLLGTQKVIGGGTYGRLFKRGVAFGAMMPGRENVMHQADEYMVIDDLLQAVAIYADAIYRLTR
ncbi:dipeptidase PepV [Lacticaseibacillus jixiensis]|uniref:dipeptidase PepV n=1 Tax=Lacticaseibacillus jixiensis TaxID=3231926 RepID=UPI0036F433A6